MDDVGPDQSQPPTTPRTRPVPLVIGIVLALFSVPILLAGLGLGWALGTQRDDDGFFTTPSRQLETTTTALSSTVVELGQAGQDDWWADQEVATVRVSAAADPIDTPVFIGIGPSEDVRAYLEDAPYDEVTSLTGDPFEYTLTRRGGSGSLAGPPGEQDFWVATASGPGARTLEWAVAPGTYTLVIMNRDGAEGLTVDVSASGRLQMLVPLAWVLGIMGALLALLAALLVVWGASPTERGGGHGAPGSPGGPTPPVRAGPASGADDRRPSPVTLTGVQDVGLSRWMWLVKWLLAVPHFVVLALLWLVFSVLTLVAFFAILVTGRYPRSLFDLDVGILRWSWRVQFYATSALGTDRYPPFSLGASAAYPADLDVAYPERLSRGLVLVKSWLLALPHLIVVSILAGAWQVGSDDGFQVTVGGLIGALTLAAGLMLLFAGRYPAPLFDLVVGLNRWVYRVIAYVALMTDDYPPFRLDQGPTEPPPPTRGPSTPAGPSASGTGWPAEDARDHEGVR
jgi:hypothetical protein